MEGTYTFENILQILFLFSILSLISDLLITKYRKYLAKKCNYDCSKCKVWDCQQHSCLECIKKEEGNNEKH